MQNKVGIEDLIESLKYSVSGDREVRRKIAIELIKEMQHEKALEHVKGKYRMQGIEALDAILQSLAEIKGAWEEEQLEVIKVEAEAKKKAKLDKALDEALEEEDDEEKVESEELPEGPVKKQGRRKGFRAKG